MATIQDIASAFAQAEGFGVAGAIPTVANNPGNLELGDIGYGTLSAAGGNQITVFPSVAAGQAALENQVAMMANGTSSVYSPSMSLSQIGQSYAGASGGSTWASNVANALGVSPSSSLSSILAGSATNAVASALGSTGSLGATASGWLGKLEPYLVDAVLLVVGLLLIAAGIFSFKETQTVIQNAGSVAKTAAEAAA